MPKTTLGKWSLGLIIIMLILFFGGSMFANTLYHGVAAGNSITEDVALRPVLAYTMLAAMLCGVLSFIIGLIAIIKQKERSLLVNLAVAVGALLLLLLIGEFIFPH